MSTKVNVSIANDFTRYPAGRTRQDGNWSGQVFREEKLERPLRAGNTVIVDLDNVLGYGSSFLEEAFGGLVRAGFTPTYLQDHLKLVSKSDPSLIKEINDYVNIALQRHPKRGV